MADASVARRAHNFKNLTGGTFGRLIVLIHVGTKRGRALWRCRCTCGNELTTIGNDLRRGHVLSCGCLQAERASARNTTHGESRGYKVTAEYRTWTSIIYRCENEKCPDYPNYGGRGITVCDCWREDYTAFLAYIGRRPSPGHSVDRINNDGNYEPGNVRWATRSEQRRNQR